MPDDQSRKGSRFTITLTNLGKLAGLVIGVHEAFGQARPAVMLYATAIYVGAQAVEDLLLKIIDHSLGGEQ